MNNKTKFIVRTAVIAALYVVITFAFYFLSYEAIQFRISEIMVLLAFIDPLYLPGLVLGCFIANFLGPFGIVDAIFGSIASLVSVYMIIQTRKWFKKDLIGLIIASLWPSIFSFVIAFEITVVYGASESFWFWTIMVAVGEFVVITLAGVPIFYWILKRKNVVNQLKFNCNLIEKEKSRKIFGRVAFFILSIFVVALVAFVLWAKLPFDIMQEANESMVTTEEVTIDGADKYISFLSNNQKSEIGYIFYVGARVDAESYAPMAKSLAEQGITVYITRPLLNIAIFDMNAAKDIIADNKEIKRWYVGGHSLGGVIASEYARKNLDLVEGVIFLGSFPNSDLSNTDLKVLSIYAENDGFTTLDEVEKSKEKLPKDTIFYKIKGGNHEQFGWYGHQKGDGKASISREEQHKEVIDAIEGFIYDMVHYE